MTDDAAQRASQVKVLLMDVDGTLTDGKLIFVPMPDGSVGEAKTFDAADGAALGLARRAGIQLGIITGRNSAAVTHRAQELHLDFVYQGLGHRKLGAFEEILARNTFLERNVCYVGDDIQDIPILRRVGFPVAVANARPEVKACVAYVTQASGGNGAIRELIEFILKAQGKWDTAIAEFLG